MAESRTTWANLLAQYADNTAGAITAEDLRDFVMSARPFVTTTAPTAASDSTLGFDFGHAWLDTTGPTLFACIDATAAAAVWVQVYPQTGGGELTDLASTGASVGQVPKADGAGGIAWAAESGGGGASAFTDLTDAPASFAGAGGKLVAVNSGATALEFVAAGGAGDVSGPSSATDGHLVVFDGTTGKLVKDGGAAPDPTIVPINAQTGTTYTLVLADAGKLVTLDNGSAITLTVPTNASVAYAVGTVIALAQLGAGLVTVAGASGVTINGVTPGDEDLAGQWATASLTKLATDTWLLSGGIA